MRFVKGLANSILTYIPNMVHICPNIDKGRIPLITLIVLLSF